MREVSIRDVQLKELEILKDVAAVCEKYKIQYYLSGGTLLGAVRHKGFIPWDDDVDISMPYQDYCRFIGIAQRELGDKYFVQTSRTDPNWYRPHAKVRLNGTAMIEKGLTSYHIHQGIWIDIFILSGISNRYEFKIKQKIITIANYLQADDYFRANDRLTMEKTVGKMGIFFLCLLYKLPFVFRSAVHDLLLKMVFNSKRKKYTTEIWSNMTNLYDSEIFDGNSTLLQFEDSFFHVPQQYEKYLEVQYGDYLTLPPEDKRETHMASIIDLSSDYSKYLN